MGWFWSSSSPADKAASSTSEITFPTPSSSTQDYTHNHTTPSNQPPLSREAQADKDVENFLASLEANDTPTNTYTRTKPSTSQDATSSTPAPQETPTHYAPTGTTDPSSHPVDLDTLDISPKALYPRSMSCRQAFDQAFYCQSLGGKFNDLYRHGGIRSCSDQWSAFWFCMRVKNLGDNERGQVISEWYEKREERIKAERGSSEDVWEIRTAPVKRAFWKDPDEVVQSWKGEEA